MFELVELSHTVAHLGKYSVDKILTKLGELPLC
jgi:hypothetical protein